MELRALGGLQRSDRISKEGESEENYFSFFYYVLSDGREEKRSVMYGE